MFPWRAGRSGFSRQVDALSRAMFRKAASEATPLADRLPLLSSLYGLLNGTSYIVDRRKTEQWDTLAEKIIHAAWEPARAGEEEILTPLCFCLSWTIVGTGWSARPSGITRPVPSRLPPRPRPSGAVCMTCPPRAMLVRWTNPWRPRLGNASYELLSRTHGRSHRGRTVLSSWWLPEGTPGGMMWGWWMVCHSNPPNSPNPQVFPSGVSRLSVVQPL